MGGLCSERYEEGMRGGDWKKKTRDRGGGKDYQMRR